MWDAPVPNKNKITTLDERVSVAVNQAVKEASNTIVEACVNGMTQAFKEISQMEALIKIEGIAELEMLVNRFEKAARELKEKSS